MRTAFRAGVTAIMVAAAATCSTPVSTIAPTTSPSDPLRIAACTVPGVTGSARCGTLSVREDRSRLDGRAADARHIALNFVVLPALGPRTTDAVAFLTGGPGQAATDGLAGTAAELAHLRQSRDLLFIDQRGTGRSNPLRCDSAPASTTLVTWLTGAFNRDSLTACARRLPADVRRYTTADAADDLDDVRAALGYDRLNVIGVSYGTRVALAYLRQHPDRARVAILRGLYPPNAKLPLFIARESESALRRQSVECAASAQCRAVTNDLHRDVVAALDSLGRSPRRLPIGLDASQRDTITLTRELASGALLFSLYLRGDPITLAQSARAALSGDYLPLVGSGLLMALNVGTSLSSGMYLSVVCNEDVAFIRDDEIGAATAGTFLGASLVENAKTSCSAWPRATLPPDAASPVRSNVPTLVISGDADPVTPPLWGEEVVRHLSRGVHLVLRDVGHVPWMTPCAGRVIADVVESGSTSGLNLSCATTPAAAATGASSSPTAIAQRPESRPTENITGIWDLFWPGNTSESKSGWLELCQSGGDVRAILGGQGELPATGTLTGDSLHLGGRRVVEFTLEGRVAAGEIVGGLHILATHRRFIGRRRAAANGRPEMPKAGCIVR